MLPPDNPLSFFAILPCKAKGPCEMPSLCLFYKVIREGLQSSLAIIKEALIGNAIVFTECLFTILVPLEPPPSQNSELMDILLIFYHKALKQNCEQTFQKLRTNSPKIASKKDYPLARNQYINNSQGVFSCIREGANTGATCICTEMNSLKNLANMRKMIHQKYFPAFA